MIENCFRAVNISRRAEFIRYTGKIDILAIEMSVAIMKRVHESL
jgi:hypothetical protein